LGHGELLHKPPSRRRVYASRIDGFAAVSANYKW
jgi:hypothetical protein